MSSQPSYSLLCAGEHSIGFLSNVFSKLDEESGFNLSKRRTKKDKARWAVDEAGLQHDGVCIQHVRICSYAHAPCLFWKYVRRMLSTGFFHSQDVIGENLWSAARRVRHNVMCS